jgi:uncharacterized protein YqeY
MSLIEKIKQDQLAARKANIVAGAQFDTKNVIKASVLTTLIGEAVAIGKNDGNRQVTDEEVVAILKKFIKNIDEVIRVAGDYRDWNKCDDAEAEKQFLLTYLPKQLTESELIDVVSGIISLLEDKSPKNMGKVLGSLKQSHAGLYDGAMASKIVKELLTLEPKS